MQIVIKFLIQKKQEKEKLSLVTIAIESGKHAEIAIDCI